MFAIFNAVDDDGDNSIDKGACDFENTQKGSDDDDG